MNLPEKYTKLIGTEVEIMGPIFSYKKEFKEPTKFNVLKVRRGTATIMDMKTMKEKWGLLNYY
jgi:glutamate formiminotransferase